MFCDFLLFITLNFLGGLLNICSITTFVCLSIQDTPPPFFLTFDILKHLQCYLRKSLFGSGALAGKLLLLRIVENDKIKVG